MIAIYVDSKLTKFEKKIKYTFDFIFNTLGYEYKYIHKLDQLQQNDILFYYGLIEPTLKEAYILAMDKILFYIPVFSELLQPEKITLEKIKNNSEVIKLIKKVPIITAKEVKVPIQYYNQTDLFYGIYKFDIIGNILFHLESSIEINGGKRDDHGWLSDEEVPFSDHHQEPFVNVLLWLIERCIKDSLDKNGSTYLVKKAYWPSAELFAASFSYNVDKLQKWSFKKMLSSTLENILIFYKIKYVFNNFLSKMKYLLTNIEEYWNFNEIDKVANLHQIYGTYFFGTETCSKKDVDYSIENSDIHKELMSNHAKGNEIALLASINSGKQDILNKQKNKLTKITGEEFMGVRHNQFNYDPRITHEFHKKNGFVYNSSIGFHKKNGFLNGMAFPYYQYDSYNIKSQNNFGRHSIELPMIFYDEHLKLSRSNKISFDNAQGIVDHLIDSIESTNGFISFNFSISNFNEISYNSQLLDYTMKQIKSKNVFVTSLIEIAQWWKKREGIEISESEDRFYLYFPSKTDKFSISLFGNFEIVQVNHEDTEVEDNTIYFKNIKLDSRIEVVLRKKSEPEMEI